MAAYSTFRRRENTLGVAFLFLTAACWGFVAITVKALTASVDPFTLSFSRVLLATLVFGLMFWAYKGDWRRLRWFAPWVLIGVVGRAGNYLLYNVGMITMPANATVILAPVQVVGTVLLAHWLLQERLQGKWPGILLSLLGLILIWWNGAGWEVLLAPELLLGNTLLILAGFASALQYVSQKALSAEYTSLEILLPVFGLSALLLAPASWAVAGSALHFPPVTWALILFLGLILTGAAYYFMGEGYKRCDASTAVLITNTGIFFTLFWSWTLLHEMISPAMILGSGLGMAGAIATIQADRRRMGHA